MINYGLKVNPHALRDGIVKNVDPVEYYYRLMQYYFGIVSTEDGLKKI